MEAGDVRVAVGAERVEIPIYVTTPEPVVALQVLLHVDLERFALVTDRQAALAGTVGPDPDFLGIGLSPYWGLPVIGIIYSVSPPRKTLPLGLRQRIVNLVFRPAAGFADGDSVQVPIVEHRVDDRLRNGSLFAVPSSDSIRANFYIPGEVRFGTSGPQEPLDLRWALETPRAGGGAEEEGRSGTDVVLRWRNGEAYDAVRIERNGAVLAELPGSATELGDPGVPAGVYTYKVRGVVAGKTTFPAQVFLSTLSAPGSFLRGDANGDGRIDISDAMATLSFLFLGDLPLRCDDGADADDDGELTLADPINTLGYLFLGTSVPRAPGTTFPWFDPTPDTLGCRR